MPPTVLFVCTGNVCRSPAAAAMAAAWTRADSDLAFASAGLRALVDEPVDPPVAAALAAVGVPVDGHRARQYAPWMTVDTELVLTATGRQAEQVLREVPQALRRVFTLKEFARLAAHADPLPGPLPAAVTAVAAMRGRVAAVPAADDDVRDPYRLGGEIAAEVVADVATAVRTILTALGVATPQRPGTPRRRPLPYRR